MSFVHFSPALSCSENQWCSRRGKGRRSPGSGPPWLTHCFTGHGQPPGCLDILVLESQWKWFCLSAVVAEQKCSHVSKVPHRPAVMVTLDNFLICLSKCFLSEKGEGLENNSSPKNKNQKNHLFF